MQAATRLERKTQSGLRVCARATGIAGSLDGDKYPNDQCT
jgi:hypothetical protein